MQNDELRIYPNPSTSILNVVLPQAQGDVRFMNESPSFISVCVGVLVLTRSACILPKFVIVMAFFLVYINVRNYDLK